MTIRRHHANFARACFLYEYPVKAVASLIHGDRENSLFYHLAQQIRRNSRELLLLEFRKLRKFTRLHPDNLKNRLPAFYL